MKNRCVPTQWNPEKTRILAILFSCAAIALGIPAIILKSKSGDPLNSGDTESIFAAAFIVTCVAVFFISVSLFNLWTSMRKYEIKESVILSHEPFRKTKTIAIGEIADIYVVVHTSIPTVRRRLGSVIRDVYDKNKIIYYVILLKEGCPTRFLVDDMSYFIRHGGAKEYILYDFVYDKASVLQLLKNSTAILHTDDTMCYLLHHDTAFEPYLERIKQEELNRLYGDLPFER